MEISIIIVNYKSENFLPDCIASLRKNLGSLKHEIIIVNNDDSELKNVLGRNFDDVIILNQGDNLGFAAACNIGASTARHDKLFFLNPDATIEKGRIADLFLALEKAHVGICSPLIKNSDKKIQPWSAGYDIDLWNLLRNNLGFPRSAVFWNSAETLSADWVSGAAIATTKSVFIQHGGFDEKFFMYFEDMDLCHRIRKSGFEILRIATVSIVHHGGKSYADKNIQKQNYYASQDYYFEKHFGRVASFLVSILRKLLVKN